MPRILSRSHMPSAAAARRRSSTASSSARRNSLVDYSTGPSSPNRQQQHRQRPRRHSTESYGLPPPEAVVTVQSARHQPQHQQNESSTSFATAITTSTQRTTQSDPSDFPTANIAAHGINSTTESRPGGKPSSWQDVSLGLPTTGTSSVAWSFGLGTSAPSVGTTSTTYSAISSLSSSPGRGIGAGSDAVGAESARSRTNPRRKPRRSRRHSADTALGVGGGFLPAPLKRNISNDYGHWVEVAEEI